MEGPQGKKEEPGQVPSSQELPAHDEKAWAGVLVEMRTMEPCQDCGELKRKLVKVCPNCEGLKMRRDATDRDKARLAYYAREIDSVLLHRKEIERIHSEHTVEIRRNREEVVASIDRQTKAFERMSAALEEFVKPRIKLSKGKR